MFLFKAKCLYFSTYMIIVITIPILCMTKRFNIFEKNIWSNEACGENRNPYQGNEWFGEVISGQL